MSQALFISESTVAKMLGHDRSWLERNAARLEQTANFPKIDPVIGKRHREAIEEWARERNVHRRSIRPLEEKHRENFDAF